METRSAIVMGGYYRATTAGVIIFALLAALGGQVRDHPFTKEELSSALKLMGLDDAEAEDAAENAVAPTAPASAAETPLPPGALRFENSPHVQFIGDFLAILSFVSDKTYRKVMSFRASRAADTIESDGEWEARRAEIGRLLKQP